jgi:metal-sulfur cluster biosynthetic enzyme
MEEMKAQIALMQVIDPELNVNIIDLGLVYGVDFTENGSVTVRMTLSTPHCPMGDAIEQGVRNVLEMAFPDRETKIDLVWEPEWNFHMISEAGREQLGLD